MFIFLSPKILSCLWLMCKEYLDDMGKPVMEKIDLTLPFIMTLSNSKKNTNKKIKYKLEVLKKNPDNPSL